MFAARAARGSYTRVRECYNLQHVMAYIVTRLYSCTVIYKIIMYIARMRRGRQAPQRSSSTPMVSESAVRRCALALYFFVLSTIAVFRHYIA